MKSYQLPKICKGFDKKREKTLMQQSMRKKAEKSWDFFITGCFIKSFNIIINHFFVSQAHWKPNFSFLVSGSRKKYQKGNGTENS